MARGLNKSIDYYYVLEDDKALPTDEQTKFYVKPKTGHDANKTTALYLKTIREKGNQRELDVSASDAADRQEFANHVTRIENYAFSEDYYQKHPQLLENKDNIKTIKTEDDEEISFVQVIEDKSLIADVCGDLPNTYLREVLDNVDKISRLTVEEKK